jgi:Ca-activated chloride channel homolog
MIVSFHISIREKRKWQVESKHSKAGAARVSWSLAVGAVAMLVVSLHGQQPIPPPAPATPPPDPAFRFKSGVELINVTATVADATGRFVPGLKQEDFQVFEDDQPVEVTHFSAERVPVSLGILLDTSGSMAGPKIQEAQEALGRFLFELLDKQDQLFLYRFSSRPIMLQDWTRDRQLLARALGRIQPNGGTAMYDAVAEAIPIAQRGENRKKSLLVISDGNDTSSATDIRDLKIQIRQSEVLVYAIGIDGEGETARPSQPSQPRFPMPVPLPFPGGGRGRGGYTPPPGGRGGGGYGGAPRGRNNDDRVNVTALRDMTDDSGGRTEIIRDPHDLSTATVSIADELSKQYYLGYPSAGKKDGRWHTIRVELRNNRSYRVRARRGYIAS